MEIGNRKRHKLSGVDNEFMLGFTKPEVVLGHSSILKYGCQHERESGIEIQILQLSIVYF